MDIPSLRDNTYGELLVNNQAVLSHKTGENRIAYLLMKNIHAKSSLMQQVTCKLISYKNRSVEFNRFNI